MVDNHEQFLKQQNSKGKGESSRSAEAWWIISTLLVIAVLSLGIPNLNPRTNYPTCVRQNSIRTQNELQSCNKSYNKNPKRSRTCANKALRNSKKRSNSCNAIFVKGNDRPQRLTGMIAIVKANVKSLGLNTKSLSQGVCSAKDADSWSGCFRSLNNGSVNTIEVANSFVCGSAGACNVQISNIKGPVILRGAGSSTVGITRAEGYKDPIISIMGSQDVFINGLTFDDQISSSCRDCSSPMLAIINSNRVSLNGVVLLGAKKAAVGVAGSDSVTIQGNYFGDSDGSGILVPYAPSQNIKLSNNIQILSNSFNNLKDVGMVISSHNTRIAGNLLSGVKTGIIANDPAKFLNISFNQFTNIMDQNIGHGIQVNTEENGAPNYVSDVSIKNNRFVNLGGWGVYRKSKNPPICKNIAISDNFFERVRCGGDPDGGLLRWVFWSCRCEDTGLKNSSLLRGSVSSDYSESLATRLSVDYTYRILNGALPEGLTLDVSSGAIKGKPTRPGVYAFSVSLNTPTVCADSRDYVIEVGSAPSSTKPVDPGTKPVTCNESLISSGQAAEGMFGVPRGLADIFTFIHYPAECSKSAKVGCPSGFTKVSQDIQLPGIARLQALCRKDCDAGQISAPAVGYRGRQGLPPGLTDAGYKRFRFITFPVECSSNPQTNCPTSFSPYQGENGDGIVRLPSNKLQRNCETTCQNIDLRSTPLPNAKVGLDYQQSIAPTSGQTMIFSLTAGALPPGMFLSSSGDISGRASKEGVFNFTVYAEDSNGCSVTKSFNLVAESSSCAVGYADCDKIGDNGCETNIDISPEHCGTCGNKCSFPNGFGSCWRKGCILQSCLDGYANCDGIDSNGCEARRESFSSDVKNCGACGKVCDDGFTCTTDSCDNGQCKFTLPPRKEDDVTYPGYKIIYYCAAEQGVRCPDGFTQEGPFNMEGFPEGRQINCKKI